MRLLVVVGIIACLGPGYESPLRPEGQDRRYVEYVTMINDRRTWENSPWWRVSDDLSRSMPIFLAVSSGRAACLLNGAEHVAVRERAWYGCPGRWRAWRP